MKELNNNDRKECGNTLSDKAKKMPTVDTSGRFKTKNKKHEAKIKKLSDIADFSTSMLHVQVDIWTSKETRQIELCRPCFEQWLNDTGRLDWCMEGYDSEGTQSQLYGTMAIDDYWENAEYEVKCKDLADYMNSSKAA